jgi:hypothetical protein
MVADQDQQPRGEHDRREGPGELPPAGPREDREGEPLGRGHVSEIKAAQEADPDPRSRPKKTAASAAVGTQKSNVTVWSMLASIVAE